MSSFVVLGTDTDVGKTAFSLLWLAAFGERYAYWKPIETGPSDTEAIRRLCPRAQVFPPLMSLEEAVAPPLAAKRAGVSLPSIDEIVARRPEPVKDCFLLVETFGSPWSPLDDERLQVELVRRLDLACVLVSSSRLGAVGRTLQALIALEQKGLNSAAVALFGEPDEYAREQIERRWAGPVVALGPPARWTIEGIGDAATQ